MAEDFFARTGGGPAPADDAGLSVVRPRRSLRQWLARWMIVLTALPVMLCMVAFSVFVHSRFMEQHSKDGDLLAEVMAASLADRLADGWDARDADFIDSLSVHPRVAFVCVTDPQGVPLHFGVFDAEAWRVFAETQNDALASRRLDIAKADMANLAHDLVVRSASVWDKRDGAGPRQPAGAQGRPLGAVIFGLHTTGLRLTVATFQVLQAGAVAVICILVFPLLSWKMRRWTRPLEELVEATRRLAAGRPPGPVTRSTDDEVGFLAGAFNDMAAKLIAGRRALLDANQRLEQRVEDRTRQLQQAVEQLDRMASTDALTGVANRRAFTEALAEHFRIAEGGDNELTCAMIDLDGFKPINDTLGHETGDRLLVLVGRLLKEACRRADVAARLGGDEFVLLLPRTDLAAAEQACRRLLERFDAEQADLLGDRAGRIKASMSIGLAGRRHSGARSAEQLLQQADKALYEAKGRGKACIRVHPPSPQARGTLAAGVAVGPDGGGREDEA